MKRIAIIGTVGVPAKYGGFETLVENLLNDYDTSRFKYTVYCSAKAYENYLEEYKGAKLKYIPLRANGVQSIFYDVWSVLNAVRGHDILLILGVSGAIILPLVRLWSSKKIIVNIDGLEHKRSKWSRLVQIFLRWSEKLAVNNTDVVIADNKAIQEYVLNTYHKNATLIAYGGDHAMCDTTDIEDKVLRHYHISGLRYALGLCRIEPENNVKQILQAFANAPEQLLIFIGNWENSDYSRMLKVEFEHCDNITLLDPIYDLPTLNVLRKHCSLYLHGHSAGGTNPSLVEAMFFGVPILAYDVSYNRETTENKAIYFKNSQHLTNMLNSNMDDEILTQVGKDMTEIAQLRYRWNVIKKQYEYLY